MRARKLLPFCLSERKMRASCVITSLQKLVLWGKSLKYHKTYDKNWENWQFVAPQRCLSFRYALLTNKAFPEVYKRCKAILLQQYHYLEEITFPGKDTDCHLLSTTTEMEGPAREKKFWSQLSQQYVTTVWVGSSSRKVSENATAFHFAFQIRKFPNTLWKLEVAGILFFGFMTVYYL